MVVLSVEITFLNGRVINCVIVSWRLLVISIWLLIWLLSQNHGIFCLLQLLDFRNFSCIFLREVVWSSTVRVVSGNLNLTYRPQNVFEVLDRLLICKLKRTSSIERVSGIKLWGYVRKFRFLKFRLVHWSVKIFSNGDGRWLVVVVVNHTTIHHFYN